MEIEPTARSPLTADQFDAWGRRLLAGLEQRLRAVLTADSPLVTELAGHLAAAGGKRFRPLLVIGAAGLGFSWGRPVDEEQVLRAALVVELTHVASLYHDDVMDSAELRRGGPSANKLWDNTLAILTGDFIFARASSVVATLGPAYVQFQADTFARLVTGQIEEVRGPAAGADRVGHHLKVVADKTGALIAASARFGGMVAGANAAQLESLTRFGEILGTVFQLSDDLIDIVAPNSGKTPGTDLREGVPTLTTLLIQAAARPQDARLLELLAAPVPPERLAEALALVRAHPAAAQVRRQIAVRAEAARQELASLPEGPAKASLDQLCDLAVTRSA
ncbi:MAG: polyprenyl synthetase family protein [Propionibacteriaceae bacterium]|jgi:heptaprenyl diphosphate synthase|nr:polyprenyl synthetase family protein [Propionibacteriaceae bacterium]